DLCLQRWCSACRVLEVGVLKSLKRRQRETERRRALLAVLAINPSAGASSTADIYRLLLIDCGCLVDGG
ncbi:hypothetical protein NQZ68_032557, partial [Dissostichus eleginoides]